MNFGVLSNWKYSQLESTSMIELNKNKLYNLYVEKNLGAKEVGRKLNVSHTTILRFLKKFEIPVKIRGGYKKFFHNDDFFKTWSHNMAYILGFIAADGHIWKNRPILDIGLHPKDIDVLCFIKDNISPQSKVTYRDSTCVRFIITSPIIVNDLKRYRVDNKKTFNMRIDFDIPKEYLGDYIRGFFDGDGSVYYYNSTIRSEFCSGSLQFLQDLKKLIGFFGGIYKKKNSNCYQLSLLKKDSIKLYNLMYSNKRFCLQRKKVIFDEIQKI